MHSLTASQLLDVWEQGARQPRAQQALALLAAASPDEPVDSLAALSVGRRDACLLALRETIFGPQLSAVAACPACGQQLEMDFQASDVGSRAAPAPGPEVYTFDLDGYQVRFRLPNSHDLLAIEGVDPAAGRQVLFERCLLAAVHQGETVAPGELPGAVLAAVAGQMAQADPLADLQLTLTCQACGHAWAAPFDIVAYLWNEIEAWAYRTLQEVHRLALAYSWSETHILHMSAWRRQFYLSLL